MRPALVVILATLTISTFAQTPIPRALLAEQPVPAPEIKEAELRGQSSVASNGETFLVATPYDRPAGYPSDPRGAMLVDSEGRPLLEATHLMEGCGVPDVASDGRDYFVAFGCRGGTIGVLYDGHSFRRIAIHETTRGMVSPHDSSGWRGVAWDGQQYVVLTTLEIINNDPPRVTPKSITTRITSDGEILQNDIDLGDGHALAIAARNGITVAAIARDGIVLRTMNAAGVVSPARQLTGVARAVEIAAGDDGFLVVWSDQDAVRAQHLDAGGNPDATAFAIGPPGVGGIALMSEGSGYRVAWSGADALIRTAFVLPSGSIGLSEVVATGARPALASNGTHSLLVWVSPSQETRARRLDAEGEGWNVHRLPSRQRLEAFTLRNGPSAIWSEIDEGYAETSHLNRGGQHLALAPSTGERFANLRDLDRPLIISREGPPWSARFLDDSIEPFELPSKTLFWTGDAILAIWTAAAPETDPFGLMTLWAQRFRIDGVAVDAQPIRIGESFDLNRGYSGRAALYAGVFAAASADEILVAYVDPGASLQGAILRNGAAIPIGEIAAPQALANPIEITSDGRDFLVTWISNKETIHSYIGSRRVLAGGAMEPMHVQSTAGDRKDAMATFWTGENYLAVWSTLVDEHREVWALRIARDGTLIDYPAQRIGTFDGSAARWAYSRGLLGMAYERDGRVYWRYLGEARRRSAAV